MSLETVLSAAEIVARDLDHTNKRYQAQIIRSLIGKTLRLRDGFGFQTSGSASGRFSSSQPSFSNIPKRSLLWHCADGRVIPVKEMSDDHLRNTVRLLRRRGFVHSQDAFACMQYASNPMSGEYAAEAAEREFDAMKWNMRADAIFNEATERGIR